MTAVLILGLDPYTVPDVDGDALHAVLDKELARFAEDSIDASLVQVAADEPDESVFVTALNERDWDVVLIGGGIRRKAELTFFERVVNLVHQHAPGAAIAFNGSIDEVVEAVRRWLPASPPS
ncbi:hypothetical protein ACTWQF_13905 [Streptomyces sp. 8N114]|uniref:hypothetical protein n=1 Tax=Streptomyces sp. 8N114 TaxID=3457419 RepID=UPI003FCFAA0E